ncbi:MAG: hypothetical protein HFJ54_07620 [Clostridia bacterium]|nr:hypothetical protein [Clostridia bacterium]
MELTKNIFFNTDKLVANTTVKISYTGKLFQDQADEVFIHYGFGVSWENLKDVKMDKTDLGFQAEITLDDSDTLSFCFNDGQGNWDNNDNQNYTFDIEELPTSLILQEDLSLDSHPRLRKSYIWSKKIRLAIYKVITYLPKLISGNYKRKISND